jgi:hypothetical protein
MMCLQSFVHYMYTNAEVILCRSTNEVINPEKTKTAAPQRGRTKRALIVTLSAGVEVAVCMLRNLTWRGEGWAGTSLLLVGSHRFQTVLTNQRLTE